MGSYFEDSSQSTLTNGTSSSADNALGDSGAAYVFRRIGSAWQQEAYFKAANAWMADGFGSAVTVASDTLAVGAPSERSTQTTITNGSTASGDRHKIGGLGAVYVYRKAIK